MNPTTDPNQDPQLFKEKADEFSSLFQFPVLETVESAERFLGASDLLMENVAESLKAMDAGYTDATVFMFGSPIAEAFRLALGGSWAYSEPQQRWVIQVFPSAGEKAELNIFNKVEKRIRNGMEDSIVQYFLMTRQMLGG